MVHTHNFRIPRFERLVSDCNAEIDETHFSNSILLQLHTGNLHQLAPLCKIRFDLCGKFCPGEMTCNIGLWLNEFFNEVRIVKNRVDVIMNLIKNPRWRSCRCRKTKPYIDGVARHSL